jgi:hypothetical protein
LPDARVSLVNFSLNPIAPTDAEMHGSGGARAWLKRGGYFLSYGMATGTKAIKTWCPSWATSVYCNCGGMPSALMGVFRENGTVQTLGVDPTEDLSGGCFDVYIKIDQHPDGNFSMSLKHQDPAWYERAAVAISGVLRSMATGLCALAPVVKSQTATMLAEKCANPKTKATCIKGQANCKCTTPNATAQGAVVLNNFVMSQWCAGWNAEYTQPPPLPPPGSDIGPPPANTLPWYIIVGGVAGIAYLLARK